MENIDKFSHRTGLQDQNSASESNSVYQESMMNNQETDVLNKTDIQQNPIHVQLVENDRSFTY